MTAASADTEHLIKETARILFFQKGFLNATTQQIADEAGVNRALIHYYFRSREQMLETLLEETVREKRERVRAILSSAAPFSIKIANYISVLIDHGLKYPYLDNFLIHETARRPTQAKMLCSRDRVRSSELLRHELEKEVAAGRLEPIPAEHFIVNLVALINYPLLAKGILQTVHGMSETGYRRFLSERKRIIYRTIFGTEMPDDISIESFTDPTPR